MKTINEFTGKKTLVNVTVGHSVKIYDFVNLYGCVIGDETQIGTFVEIQSGVKIGKRCRIQSHAFICDGVTIEDNVFIGHGVIFINDNKPSVEKTLKKTWVKMPVLVESGATIGSGAVILGGITIGENSFIGAGAVVTNDVPKNTIVVGVPAKSIAKRK